MGKQRTATSGMTAQMYSAADKRKAAAEAEAKKKKQQTKTLLEARTLSQAGTSPMKKKMMDPRALIKERPNERDNTSNAPNPQARAKAESKLKPVNTDPDTKNRLDNVWKTMLEPTPAPKMGYTKTLTKKKR